MINNVCNQKTILKMRFYFACVCPAYSQLIQMRCLTRIFHPNIDDTTGKICASFLDDSKWVPTHTILSMLQSMYVVMFQGNICVQIFVASAISLPLHIPTGTILCPTASTLLNCC
jgi:hypothetical protein